MHGELLYGVGETIIIVSCFFLFWGTSELGFFFGRRVAARGKKDAHPHADMIETAFLTLLALLLSFTFMMAMTRFDTRKQTILAEANDIGTAFLRAELLPGNHPQQSQRLLQDYLESRISYYRAGINLKEKIKALETSSNLKTQLWSQAIASVGLDPNEVTSGYFIASLNNVFDDQAKGSQAMSNHVPEVVLILLMFTALLTFVGLRGLTILNPKRINL